MGTDIHAVFEAKIDGKWRVIESEYDECRDYTLFALIAGVRNHYDLNPIVPVKRGIPEDISFGIEDMPLYMDGSPNLWLGDHSFSYITADECAAYVSKHAKFWGFISIEAYREWDGKRPKAYCLGIGAKRDVVATHPEYITPITEYVKVTWHEVPNCGYFFDEMARLKEKYGEVRMIFGFDS